MTEIKQELAAICNTDTPGWERPARGELAELARSVFAYFGGTLSDQLYYERMAALERAREGDPR